MGLCGLSSNDTPTICSPKFYSSFRCCSPSYAPLKVGGLT